jgi:serine O-acetyltransferase
MNQHFINDFYRMTGEQFKGSPKDYIKIILHHNLRFMFLFRKYQKRKSILTRIALYRLTRKYGLELSVGANIGDGLYLGHPYNITVAEGTVIGSNVNLHKGCTIGRECRGKREGTPTIGNRVFVGINATIVGNITIGDDVLIAPNSFVNRDIPAHSVVIGNPTQIYARNDATESYVNFLV